MARRSILYLAESAGGRVLAYGSGISQVGTEYQVALTTQDAIPSGEVGDNVFRSVDLAINASGAFSLAITPVIDGVDQEEQQFSGAASGETTCQAFVAVRGARVAARVRTISRAGRLEFENMSYSFVPIRTFP